MYSTELWNQYLGRGEEKKRILPVKVVVTSLLRQRQLELDTSILPAYSANFPTLLSSSQHCLVEVLSPSDSNGEESKD